MEFSLVLAAKKILDEHYEYVVPIYPWMGRELSKMSRELHSIDGFKVLSVFPRRPKNSVLLLMSFLSNLIMSLLSMRKSVVILECLS